MLRSSRTKHGRKYSLETLEARCLLAADVYISEFLASNDGTLVDSDGDDSDWVEIYNAGPDDVSLDGWHLTDSVDDLSKWSFPNQSLSAGNFLLVYASGKDRSVAGEELHTSYKLSAGGEYLALTQSVGDAIEVVSEFAPEYPTQITDVSYGLTQSLTVNSLLTGEATGKLLVPTQEPAANWNDVSFNDNSWTTVTGAIGFQSMVSGFTVQDAKSTGTLQNLSEADRLLAGTGVSSETIVVSPFIDYLDSQGGGGTGRFNRDVVFPNDTGSDDNDFAIRATGTIIVPTGGTWTFGVNSDDGARVRVGGQSVINDDTLHAPRDSYGTISLDAGTHDIELVFFERGGGAEVELFAAAGSRTSWDAAAFDLVGDVANGGLEVLTSATGGTTAFSGIVSTDVGDALNGNATSAYLRMPFEVADPTTHDTLTLRMKYDDGFVAYLNGEEVARRNVPTSVNYQSTALSNRSPSQSTATENISIDTDLLRAGDNVLAIHGLNDAVDSDEFLISAELVELELTSGDRVYFLEPTPLEFNASSGVTDFLLDDVTFSHEHGFYDSAFSLTLQSATEGTSIRYTTDGTEPTLSNGQLYAGPISVSETSTFRAASFKAGTDPSYVMTATYLFLADVVEQSGTPTGWPTSSSINGQTLNYGMDPDIVDSTQWGSLSEEALTQIPSMSVVMDVDDLLGSSQGIYTHAGSHGKAWEREASLELLQPDGTEGFQVEAGIRIRGGFSRSGGNPKHAFRLFFRDEYGDSKLEFPLFGEEGVDAFDKFDLRTAQNYSWSFQGDGRNAFVRDVFSRDVQGIMGQPYTRSRFYHLYINGTYWGMYQSQERADARYAASNLGGDSDDYDVVKSAGSSGGYQNEATDGTLDAYERLSAYFYQGGGLGNANMADYWKAQGLNADGSPDESSERLLDVDNLISYMTLTYFTSDADGPGSKFTRPRVNNYYAIFNRESPDGFKFFEHDSEHSLDTGNAAGANYNMVTPLTTGGSQFRYFNPQWMHEQLARDNDVYREKFADAVYKNLFHDGPLEPENAKAVIDARASQIDMAIVAESARWGDAKRSTAYTKSNWESAVNNVKGFFDGRAETVLQQLRGQDWYPAENPPEFTVNNLSQHGGEVDPTDSIGLVTSSALSYTTILRRGATWSYLDDGSDQGTAWRASDFDDASWDSGRAQLGYGNNGERTEVSFGNNSRNKHRTTYFRTTFDVENPGEFEGGQIRLIRDDGAIVYLNGEEIARSNMPAGTVNSQTFAAGTVGGGDESALYEYTFPIGLLRSGENTLAVEVHQTNANSSDLSFDLELRLGQSNEQNSGIYFTTDGSDPKLQSGDVNSNATEFSGSISLPSDAIVSVRARAADGSWSVLNQANFVVPDGVGIPGDLDNDGDVDAADIDAMSAAIRDALAASQFDLNGDGNVNVADRDFLVEDILNTRAGDADLDGVVGFADFLKMSQNFGSLDAGWERGNFGTDTTVSFADFLVLSQNFGQGGAAAALVDAALVDDSVSDANDGDLNLLVAALDPQGGDDDEDDELVPSLD